MFGIMNRHRVTAFLRYISIIGALLSVSAGSSFAGKVMLDSAQAIKLVAFDSRSISSSRSAVGDTVTLRVAVPVKLGGMIIIDTTATASAVVTDVSRSAARGRPGRIGIKCLGLRPTGQYKVDGGFVKLTGSSDKTGTNTAFFSYLLGFGLLIKGGNATFTPQDTIVTRTAEPVLLEN